MSAEEAFAEIGRGIDWFWEQFTQAVRGAATAYKRTQDTIWRASHHGDAAEAVGEYTAYRSAVMAIHQAATTDTRVEMRYALARGHRQARAATDLALADLRRRLLEGGS